MLSRPLERVTRTLNPAFPFRYALLDEDFVPAITAVSIGDSFPFTQASCLQGFVLLAFLGIFWLSSYFLSAISGQRRSAGAKFTVQAWLPYCFFRNNIPADDHSLHPLQQPLSYFDMPRGLAISQWVTCWYEIALFSHRGIVTFTSGAYDVEL